MKNLPGIFQISSLPVDELTLYPKRFLTPGSTTSAPSDDWSKLPLVGLASCKVTDEVVDAGIVYTTTIEGTCEDNDEFNASTRNKLRASFHAFKIMDIYKNESLVGIDREPFPEISFAPTIDGTPSGTRSVPFTIIWKSTLPPIELVAL